MATPFRLKRSAIEGKRPAQADLQLGELALNTYDGYLYTEREGVGLATVTNLTPWYENYGGGSIYYSNSVGIGTTIPQYNLDVRKGSIGGYDTLIAQHSDVVKEISVVVASKTNDHRYQGQGSGNAYVLDGIQAPVLTLTPGRTYKFNLSSSDMSNHPFRFYLDEAKSVQYTDNVTTTATSAQITITDDTPNILHYQCSSHGYMGNALIINSNVVNSPYAATLRSGLNVTGGNVSINNNLDVDGNTTLDGTTIDGLLDINAGGQANTFKVEDLTSGRIVIAGTGGELEDSGNLLFNGTDLSTASLIVSDLTDGRVLIAGGSGAVEDTANLKFDTTKSEFEVVGHSVFDTVVASGIVTATSFVGSGTALTGIDASTLKFGGAVKAQATASGVTITGDLGVSGVLTYEDVTNVDSIGIITARSGVNVTGGNVTIANNIDVDGRLDVDGHAGIGSLSVTGISTFHDAIKLKADATSGSSTKRFYIGAGDDLRLFHDSANSYIQNHTGDLIIGDTNHQYFRGNTSDKSVSLYFNGLQKFKTITSGIDVTGTVVADGLDVSGHAGIGSITVAGVTTSTGGFVGNLTGTASLATDLAINGTNQLLYQDSNNDTAILPTGSAGQILQSNGAGAEPQWVTSAPAGAIEGITIRDENSIVGTANSISTINFVGSNVTADAAVLAGISTVQIDHMTIQDEGSVVGTAGSISTLNFVGAGIAAAVSGSTATITAAGGATQDDIVALAIALG